MPSFRYRARDPAGKLVVGAGAFDTEEDARAFLRANKLMALELRAVNKRGSAGFMANFQKLDLVTVVRQLAIMIRTGVPLDRAFDVLLDQEHHPKLTEALRQAA